jgi:hypothetical protein
MALLAVHSPSGAIGECRSRSSLGGHPPAVVTAIAGTDEAVCTPRGYDA